MYKVLVTCPPMIGQIDAFYEPAQKLGLELVPADTEQVLSEDHLIELLPGFDGWIIGDDPATRVLFNAGVAGKLKAAVKWGIGVDNVDFQACDELGISITNTPNMFGGEVADVAIAMLLGLARQTYFIDRGVRDGAWPKPAGSSVSGKHIGIVGFGDIGRNLVKRLRGFDVRVTAYDPGVEGDQGFEFVTRKVFPEGLESCDFLIFTCALNSSNYHMLNATTLAKMKKGSRIVNVARGPLIDEEALTESLREGHIAGAALDVFELEPLPMDSPLRKMPQCIFGSHNGSNTIEAVERATTAALIKISGFLHEQR